MSYGGGERSPKRQRLESYSPASPPLAHESKAFAGNEPHTPPPSVRMSPSWQAQSLPSQHGQVQAGVAGNVTIPTPPSTAGFHSQTATTSASSEGGDNSGRATPAADEDGETRKDTDGDTDMTNGEGGTGVDADCRRTDHERKGGGGGGQTSHPGALTLHTLSSTTLITASRPHPSQDLLDIYDLKKIQESVARRHPVTGEKINKLRKSYEGKVKLLGLEGRNKAQPNQKDLEGLVDPGWDNRTPDDMSWWQASLQGVELGNEAAENDIFSKLDTALSFQPGRLPGREHEQWKNVLGLDDVPNAVAAKAPAAATATVRPNAATNAIARTGPDVAMRNSAPSSPKSSVHRPERANKKRRYDESSYSGYQDGFDDDGYSTGGIDDTGRRHTGSVKRQKRKDISAGGTNTPPFSSNASNSGNMVGIKSS